MVLGQPGGWALVASFLGRFVWPSRDATHEHEPGGLWCISPPGQARTHRPLSSRASKHFAPASTPTQQTSGLLQGKQAHRPPSSRASKRGSLSQIGQILRKASRRTGQVPPGQASHPQRTGLFQGKQGPPPPPTHGQQDRVSVPTNVAAKSTKGYKRKEKTQEEKEEK